VGYNFEGGFWKHSLTLQDENGEEIPNIREYFEIKEEGKKEDDGEEGDEREK
jgi:hypothetical protein